MKKTALVTGGAGFIGSHVAHELLNQGLEVVVLDNLSGGFVQNVPEGAHFEEGDINDARLVHELFDVHNFQYVYHLAAYAAENLSHFIKRYNYENNLIGSMNLINAAVNHNVECFVFTSSIAVYGHCKPPVAESQTPVPSDSYGIAKYAVEQELRITQELFGLPFVIFRPHNVYGPAQNIGDRYRNVIGIFMNAVMQDKPMPIFGTGNQSRAFTYVDDVAPYIARSPWNPRAIGETYNIGAEEVCSVNQLSDLVAEVMNVPAIAKHLEARNELEHVYANQSKFNEHFSPTEPTSLRDGLARMAAWALEHGPRQSKPFDNIEVRRNLPPVWNDLPTAVPRS